MTRGGLLRIVCAAWLGAACAPAPDAPAAGAEQSLRADVASVEFGMPFALEARRAWHPSLEPAEWSEPSAPSLRLEPLAVERRDGGPAPYESRRYRARALTLDAELHVVLPAWHATAREGTGTAIAPEQRLALQIRSALDPAQPGPYELPRDLEVPRGVTAWLLAAAAAAAAWIAWRLFAARRAAAEAPPPPEPADARAAVRARLRALALRGIPDRAAERAFHDEAAGVARAWLAAHGVPGVVARTREELLRAWGARPGGAQLDVALAACERVQFARAPSDEASRARLLAALADVLEAEQ